MLGEAFLHVLNYTEKSPEHIALTRTNKLSRVISRSVPPPEAAATHLSSRSALTPRPLPANQPEGPEKSGPHLTSPPSTALPIPSSSVEDHWGLKAMYCPSFYKAYPDLQLAGDTVGPLNTPPQSHSPLLNSEDLGFLEASMEPRELVEDHGMTDEAYLVMESMKSLGKEQRLTNSMLNGFLETQLMEVYRQHMQDSLARCGSSSLSAGVVPGICGHLSASDRNTTTQGNELHSSQSQSSIRYLSTCSAPPTSHFSTPVLRISYQQEPES
ncbi:TLR adapter interacting with SLC15A4 on the lysosome [Tachysurus vachellii]|nr:TLR adapter interacting with SLC15A4 on the lysosome [Tachysurus vachellii]